MKSRSVSLDISDCETSQAIKPHLQKVYVVCAKPREAPIHTLFHLLRCDARLLPILSEILVAIAGHLAPQEWPWKSQSNFVQGH